MSVGTHQSHCCARHGCKYGKEDCAVETGQVEQSYPCEQCHSSKHLKKEIAQLQEELAWAEKLESRGLSPFGYDE